MTTLKSHPLRQATLLKKEFTYFRRYFDLCFMQPTVADTNALVTEDFSTHPVLIDLNCNLYHNF